ncbi:MAG: hypothetical protein ACLU8J_10245 [Acutalibacter sp.]
MEVQTENEKKKVPLSTGLKWLRLVCMAVVFGIIAGGVMVGMNTSEAAWPRRRRASPRPAPSR